MSTDYSRALGARLRAIRNQQGLSLQGVEDKGHGRWKAVGVGSYERGDGGVTVQGLSELAVFYGVPVSGLRREPPAAAAGGWATEMAVTERSPCSASRSSPCSTACRYRSCCPTRGRRPR